MTGDDKTGYWYDLDNLLSGGDVMMGEHKFLIIGAGVAALALLILVKKNGAANVGNDLGSAAVDLAGGVVVGAAESIGEVFGIPQTNMTECEKAKAEGRWWDASFACPAGDFISSGAGAATDTVSDW